MRASVMTSILRESQVNALARASWNVSPSMSSSRHNLPNKTLASLLLTVKGWLTARTRAARRVHGTSIGVADVFERGNTITRRLAS